MKNKKELIVYSSIAFIIIIVVVISILHLTTDIFKSNQQLFYKYLGQIKIIDTDFITQYKLANDVLYKKSSSSDTKVTVLNSKVNQETQISDIQELFSIDSKGLNNALLSQSYRDFVFLNNNQTFLNVKCIKDNNTYGIIADNILGKYLSVDNTNLKELFSKLKIKNTGIVPESITTDYKEIFKFDDSSLESIKETYVNLIYENIQKENYYNLKNEDKTEVLGVSLSEKELFDIIKLILDTVKNDNTLLNLIVNKLQLLNYNDITVEVIQTKIQEYMDKINNNTYSSDRDYIKLFLTIKEEKVLHVEIEVNYKEEIVADEADISYTEHNRRFKLDLSETNNISLTIIEDNDEIISVIVNCICDNEKINLYSEMNFHEYGEVNTLKIQYQISDYQTDNIKQAAVLDIILPNEKYQVDIKNNTTLKEDVQISKLTTENSVKINEMTSEELEQIKNALLNRINELYSIDLTKLYNDIIEK